MDPLSSPQISPTPTPLPSQSFSPKPPRMWIIIFAVILILVAGGAYVLGAQQSKSPAQQAASVVTTVTKTPISQAPEKMIKPTLALSPTPVGTQIVSVDAATSRYINPSYGFSILFSKTTAIDQVPIACKPDFDVMRGTLQTKVFEDPTNNSIYFAYPQYATYTYKTDATTGIQTPTSCTIHQTTLDGLLVSDKEAGPNYTKYTYMHAQSDADLQKLITQVSGTGYTLGKQTPTAQTGIMSVEILYNGRGLMTAYTFLYLPAKQLAIVGDFSQDCIWPKIAGNSCGTKIEFTE